MLINISEQQQKALIQIINVASIKGQDAEFVAQLKKTITTDVTDNYKGSTPQE